MALRFASRKTVSSSALLLKRSSAAGGRSASSSSSSKSNRKAGDDRLASVIDAVNDRKLPPELRGQRNNVRSETDIINVVEHRVWHAMEEGQFENLPGKGKPLDLNTNLHADPAEDTLYRILNKNGCAPEWVELNKEIRSSIAGWRRALRRAWMDNYGRDDSKWLETSEALKLQLRDFNNKFPSRGYSGERKAYAANDYILSYYSQPPSVRRRHGDANFVTKAFPSIPRYTIWSKVNLSLAKTNAGASMARKTAKNRLLQHLPDSRRRRPE